MKANRRRWRTLREHLSLPYLRPLLQRQTLVAIGAAMTGMMVIISAPFLWSTIRHHDYFAVPDVETSGYLRLSRDEVLEWAGVGPGSSIWDAHPNVVAARLRRHPWIEQAHVRRSLPRAVSIRIRERVPVAILATDDLRYVDRAGQVLGVLNDADSRDLPLITGLDPQDDQFFSVGVHRALQLLRWCDRLRCNDTISEIHIDRARGATIFPLRNAVPVILGWGQWRQKLQRSARVFAMWQGQVDRLVQIDVSFAGQAVVKLREARPAKRPAKKGLRV